MTVRSFAFGWPGWSTAAAVLLFSAGILFYNNNAAPLLLSICAIFFAAHCTALFLREHLDAEQLLDTDVARHLPDDGDVNGLQLMKAAVHSERGRFLLDEMGMSPEEFIQICGEEAGDTDPQQLIGVAKNMIASLHEEMIGGSVLVAACLLDLVSGSTVLAKADLSHDDMQGLLHWESFRSRFCLFENPWSAAAIRRNASLGRSWVMGYTDALDSLTTEIDASEYICGEKSIIIHKPLIERALRVLTKTGQRNMLLIGGIGTGRRTLVRNIAAALRSLQREQHKPFTRILLLHTEKLLSGTIDPDAFLLKALARASDRGTFVLVIPDFAALLASANQNLKTVLMKCLESTAFGIIGIVETQDYHSRIKTDPALDHAFEKIDVEDATDDETMEVLMARYFSARHRNVHLTYKAMQSIITLAKRYLSTNLGMPGKAITVMDDAVQRAAERGDKYLTEVHVREVVSARGKVNVQKVDSEERERLMQLDSLLSEHVIDQPDAIKAVSGALKRARIDLGDRNRPVGTFLFLGPTGVGKTQTAKTLAEQFFGSVEAMIRLDMNEYSHTDSMLSITGVASGGDGFLAQRVQDRPFSLILLDEIEKAHPSVLNVFLQILDEGFLSDAKGVRTDFRNTIIIATSNAGALFIRDYIRSHESFDHKVFKKELLDTILHDRIFSPEFVNRFDEVVIFYPLSEQGIEKVAVLMLDDIISDIQRKRGISIQLEADVIGGLVERGYSIEFGAREMRRTITGIIEDYLANYMLEHDVKRGETITLKKEDLKW